MFDFSIIAGFVDAVRPLVDLLDGAVIERATHYTRLLPGGPADVSNLSLQAISEAFSTNIATAVESVSVNLAGAQEALTLSGAKAVDGLSVSAAQAGEVIRVVSPAFQ
ncbi:MAG: hypothetical protein U0531_07945 [Dehalococcoidia bacterium]